MDNVLEFHLEFFIPLHPLKKKHFMIFSHGTGMEFNGGNETIKEECCVDEI
jgi:hypothetical protein